MTYRDQNDQIDIAVLDFSKAFDTVPHDLMLGKLEFFGITGPVLNWTVVFLKMLSDVDTAKYLGINLSSELSWSTHVSCVVRKANSTFGFLRRNLRKCPSKLKETAYLSLVRSTLEYAYYVHDIDSLEQVQRHAARFTAGDYHTKSSVTAMLAELGWKR